MTATLRSEEKAQQLLRTHPEWKNKLKFGYVPELTTPNTFDKLFEKRYNFIIHTASPVAFVVKDVKADLIDPALKGQVPTFLCAIFVRSN